MVKKTIDKKPRVTPPELSRPKTYLIAIDYEEMAAYPVRLLMRGVTERDRKVIEYMETHQGKPNSEWSTEMLLAIQRRVENGRTDDLWRPGTESGAGFSTEWTHPIQWHHGKYLPYYFGRIDCCLTVTIPEWASSSEEDSSEPDAVIQYTKSTRKPDAVIRYTSFNNKKK